MKYRNLRRRSRREGMIFFRENAPPPGGYVGNRRVSFLLFVGNTGGDIYPGGKNQKPHPQTHKPHTYTPTSYTHQYAQVCEQYTNLLQKGFMWHDAWYNMP